jgi:serine/threonine protein kinase
MADRVGQQLGNYKLARLLGRGGFAEVYLGEHVRLSTQAAIKVLSTQLAAEDEAIFQQEARTIAALEQPHGKHIASASRNRTVQVWSVGQR